MMDKYLRSSLKKGVPSIYISIKVHYKDPEKVREKERERDRKNLSL